MVLASSSCTCIGTELQAPQHHATPTHHQLYECRPGWGAPRQQSQMANFSQLAMSMVMLAVAGDQQGVINFFAGHQLGGFNFFWDISMHQLGGFNFFWDINFSRCWTSTSFCLDINFSLFYHPERSHKEGTSTSQAFHIKRRHQLLPV